VQNLGVMKLQLAAITGMTVDCAGRPWVAHFGGARTGAPFAATWPVEVCNTWTS